MSAFPSFYLLISSQTHFYPSSISTISALLLPVLKMRYNGKRKRGEKRKGMEEEDANGACLPTLLKGTLAIVEKFLEVLIMVMLRSF